MSTESFRQLGLRTTFKQGGFLNIDQANELNKMIESNHSIHFENKNDVRQMIFNIDNPLLERVYNGVKLKVTNGLIESNTNTFLLYANDTLVGKFYDTNEITQHFK